MEWEIIKGNIARNCGRNQVRPEMKNEDKTDTELIYSFMIFLEFNKGKIMLAEERLYDKVSQVYRALKEQQHFCGDHNVLL